MPRDLRQFFDKMATSLRTLARDGKALQLAKKLDEYEKLLDCWLEVAPHGIAAPVPFSFNATEPRFAGPLEIDLNEVIRAGGASGDVETSIALINAVTSYLFRARRAEQLKLYADFSRMLWFCCYLGMQNEDLRPAIGAAFDRALHSILSNFKSRHRSLDPVTDEEAHAIFQVERPYLDVALGLCLSLISLAMEVGDTKHAGYFFGRLIEHRRFDQDRWTPDRRGPSSEDEDTLHDYAMLMSAGWALHLLEENYQASAEAARHVLSSALGHVKEQHELVALWELYHTGTVFEAAIDQRLGVSHWDLRERGEMRVGISVVRTGGGEWRERGLYASLLRAETPHQWDIEKFFEVPPPRYMWDADRLEGTLNQLAAENHLGIPEGKRAERVASVVSLIRARQLAADAAYAQLAATAPLDAKRCEKLKRDAARSMQKHRQWVDAIHKLGGTAQPATFATPPTLEVGRYVPRDYLIPESNLGNGLGEWVGENAALLESVRLVGLAEEKVERGQAVTSLAHLADAVREARRELVNRGYDPNLLVVPGQDRFAGALFQKPLWQVEERQEFGEIGYGMWEGLHVLRFPYTDPQSIIVADAARLFGTVGDSPSQIEVTIRELTEGEIAELARKKAEESGDRAEQRQEAQVLVTIRTRPLFGIAVKEGAITPDAALALDISDSDGGYAMVPGDHRYHRPSCPEIEFEEETKYGLLPRLPDELEDRVACQTCHPERWNPEARRGKIDNLESG